MDICLEKWLEPNVAKLLIRNRHRNIMCCMCVWINKLSRMWLYFLNWNRHWDKVPKVFSNERIDEIDVYQSSCVMTHTMCNLSNELSSEWL